MGPRRTEALTEHTQKMADEPRPRAVTFDASVAHSARIYDYWLLRHEALRYRVGVRDPRRQAVAAV